MGHPGQLPATDHRDDGASGVLGTAIMVSDLRNYAHLRPLP